MRPLHLLRGLLRDFAFAGHNELQVTVTETPNLRAMPGQAGEGGQWLYAPGGVTLEQFAKAAMNVWGWTAIDKIATEAAMAEVQVVGRTAATRLYPNHPLLDLIGFDGRPNDAQDSLEFMTQHFQTRDAAGNVFWYWYSAGGGAPTEVYQLPPSSVQIIPGTGTTIKEYEYSTPTGIKLKIPPWRITHFKRPSPYSRYVGMSPLVVLEQELKNDAYMLRWNQQFFKAGLPAGILVVPADTTKDQREKISEELNAQFAERRNVAVVAAEAGSTVWLDAGSKQRDLDFTAGRAMSRQTFFDLLDLPTGMLSETSTEAHARVAERRFLYAVWQRHRSTDSVLTNALQFWPGWDNKRVQHKDVRVSDWQQESFRLAALAPITTINERRAIHGLAPVPWGEKEAENDQQSAGDEQDSAESDNDTVRETEPGQESQLLAGDD